MTEDRQAPTCATPYVPHLPLAWKTEDDNHLVVITRDEEPVNPRWMDEDTLLVADDWGPLDDFVTRQDTVYHEDDTQETLDRRATLVLRNRHSGWRLKADESVLLERCSMLRDENLGITLYAPKRTDGESFKALVREHDHLLAFRANAVLLIRVLEREESGTWTTLRCFSDGYIDADNTLERIISYSYENTTGDPDTLMPVDLTDELNCTENPDTIGDAELESVAESWYCNRHLCRHEHEIPATLVVSLTEDGTARLSLDLSREDVARLTDLLTTPKEDDR